MTAAIQWHPIWSSILKLSIPEWIGARLFPFTKSARGEVPLGGLCNSAVCQLVGSHEGRGAESSKAPTWCIAEELTRYGLVVAKMVVVSLTSCTQQSCARQVRLELSIPFASFCIDRRRSGAFCHDMQVTIREDTVQSRQSRYLFTIAPQ